MPLQGKQLSPCGGIPHLRRVIVTHGDDALAIRTPGGHVNSVCMAVQGGYGLAGGRIPNSGRLILTRRDDALTIRMDLSTACVRSLGSWLCTRSAIVLYYASVHL